MLLGNVLVLFVASTTLPSTLAVHGRFMNSPRRSRPHDRIPKKELGDSLSAQKRQSCTNGQFQCSGQTLQQCSNNVWVQVAVCQDETVCSDDPSAGVGCVWATTAGSGGSSYSASGSSVNAQPSTSLPSGGLLALPSQSSSSGSVPSGGASSGSLASLSSGSPNTSPSGLPVTSSSHSSVVSGDAPFMSVSSGQPSGGASSGAGLKPVPSGQVSSQASAVPSNGGSSSMPEVSNTPSGGSPSISMASGLPASVSTSAGTVVTGAGPAGPYSAPHYALYQDRSSQTLPSASTLKPWNRYLLAFWTTSGAQDMVMQWTEMTTQQSTLQDYHSNGIALMVSAFGSTDYPTSQDPSSTAQKLAAFVKEYGFDGVDVDYEDSAAFIAGTAEQWLISFTTELRNQLPSPYLISHAPQPPYMAVTQFTAKGGGYKTIAQAVGDKIDFYNVQYYNQGTITPYEDCNSIVISDNGTALLEIAAYNNIPLNKLVLGKPLETADVSNTGYMPASTLAQCYSLAKSKGWNAGVMAWQWDTTAQGWLNTVLGS